MSLADCMTSFGAQAAGLQKFRIEVLVVVHGGIIKLNGIENDPNGNVNMQQQYSWDK